MTSVSLSRDEARSLQAALTRSMAALGGIEQEINLLVDKGAVTGDIEELFALRRKIEAQRLLFERHRDVLDHVVLRTADHAAPPDARAGYDDGFRKGHSEGFKVGLEEGAAAGAAIEAYMTKYEAEYAASALSPAQRGPRHTH